MVMSAYEHFLKLEFWAEAVECLLIADKRVMAMDLIKERLEVRRPICCRRSFAE